MLVATYGTLKTGYSNNRCLNGSPSIGMGIVRNFKLFNSGFPVASPSSGDSINVEVFDIGDPTTSIAAGSTLIRLDNLEGYHPDYPNQSMYHRHEVTVHTQEGDVTASMYVGNPKYWHDFTGHKEMGKDDNGVYQWP